MGLRAAFVTAGLVLAALVAVPGGPAASSGWSASFAGTGDAAGDDWQAYRFTPPDGAEVTVTLSWSDAAAALRLNLYRPDGSFAGRAPDANPTSLTFTADAGPGEWKVGIKTRTGASTYTVEAVADATGPPDPPAEPVVFTGTVSASGPSFRSHYFDAVAGQPVDGELRWTGGGDLQVSVFDESGKWVTKHHGPTPLRFSQPIDATGPWRFGVKARSGTGDYELELSTPRPPAGVSAVDRTAEAGLTGLPGYKSYASSAHDVDGDGDEDFFYNGHNNGPHILYRNDGGTFTPMWNPEVNDRHECDWGDVDGDGRDDLYCTHGAGGGVASYPHGDNELWLQVAPWVFENRAAEWGVTDRLGRGRTPVLFDEDGDGDLDLYVTNHPGRADGQPSINRLFRNVDNQHFDEVLGTALTGEIGGYCAEAVDVDVDGDLDIAVCGDTGFHLFVRSPTGTYTDAAAAGLASFARDALWADLDADGDPDLVKVSRTAATVWHNAGDGTFTLAAQRTLRTGRSLAGGDVDGDGDLDLYVQQYGNAADLDVVLQNAGDGSAFAVLDVPAMTAGEGDDVVGLDHDGDGLGDFAVLNGRHKAHGPLVLVAFESS